MGSEEDDVPASAVTASPNDGLGFRSRDYFAMVDELTQANRQLKRARALAEERAATIDELSLLVRTMREERARDHGAVVFDALFAAGRALHAKPRMAEIEARVASFVAEIEGSIRRAALASAARLLDDAPPTASVTKRARRSPEDVARAVAAIEAHLAAHPGQSLEEIAKALGVPSKDLQAPIARLLSAKSISKKGQTRATKYFVAVSAEETPAAAPLGETGETWRGRAAGPHTTTAGEPILGSGTESREESAGEGFQDRRR